MKVGKWYIEKSRPHCPSSDGNVCAEVWPTEGYDLDQEYLDTLTVIHYDTYVFHPIILSDTKVIGDGQWTPSYFYESVCLALRIFKEEGEHCRRYSMWKNGSHVQWGCRRLTRSQLQTIKKTMEWHYTKKQLRR